MKSAYGQLSTTPLAAERRREGGSRMTGSEGGGLFWWEMQAVLMGQGEEEAIAEASSNWLAWGGVSDQLSMSCAG